MQKGKVVIFNGRPETQAKVNHYKTELQLKTPNKRITQGDAVEHAIQEAEKVPTLEAENAELKKKIKELEKQMAEEREMRE